MFLQPMRNCEHPSSPSKTLSRQCAHTLQRRQGRRQERGMNVACLSVAADSRPSDSALDSRPATSKSAIKL